MDLAVSTPSHFLGPGISANPFLRFATTIGSPDHQIDHGNNSQKEQELCHGLSDLGKVAGRGERIRTSDSCVPKT